MCNRIEVFIIGYSLIEPEPSVFVESYRRNNFSKKNGEKNSPLNISYKSTNLFFFRINNHWCSTISDYYFCVWRL